MGSLVAYSPVREDISLWDVPVSQLLRGPRWEDHQAQEFKNSLGNIARSHLLKKGKKEKRYLPHRVSMGIKCITTHQLLTVVLGMSIFSKC